MDKVSDPVEHTEFSLDTVEEVVQLSPGSNNIEAILEAIEDHKHEIQEQLYIDLLAKLKDAYQSSDSNGPGLYAKEMANPENYIETRQGNQVTVYKNSVLESRENTPSHIIYYDTGEKKYEAWHKKGEFHREDGPAQIHYAKDGSVIEQRSFIDGVRQ